MKLYPFTRRLHDMPRTDRAIGAFSSSPTLNTAAYRKPCPVDHVEDMDALIRQLQGTLGVTLEAFDGAAFSRFCLGVYEAVGGDDQPIRPEDPDEDRSPGLWFIWLPITSGGTAQLRVDTACDKWCQADVPELVAAVLWADPVPEGKKTGWGYPAYEENLTGEPVRPFMLR